MKTLNVGDWVWPRGNSRPGPISEIDNELVDVLAILGDGVATTMYRMSFWSNQVRPLTADELTYWRPKIAAILNGAGVDLEPQVRALFFGSVVVA